MTNQTPILPATTEGVPDATKVASAPLSEEAKAALVEKWRGFLAGTIQPEVISFPAEVDRVVQRGTSRPGRRRPCPETFARRRLDQFLVDYYPVDTVLTLDTPAGPAIIAVGEEEVNLFWRSFRDEIGVRVDVHYPI